MANASPSASSRTFSASPSSDELGRDIWVVRDQDGTQFTLMAPNHRVSLAARAVSAARRLAGPGDTQVARAAIEYARGRDGLDADQERTLDALEQVVEEWSVCDHDQRCCVEHGTHARMLHRGCVLR